MFAWIAATKPRAALCLCFAVAPVQRSLPSLPFKMTLADLNVLIAFVVFCIQRISSRQSIRWGPLGMPIVVYLLICAVSSITDWRGDATILSFAQMVPYFLFDVIVFSSFGRGLEALRPAIYGLLCVGLFLGLSVIASGSPQVYGMNKNGLGSSLACIAVVAAELWLSATNARKKRIFLGCLGVVASALLITLSRGAWMGATAGLGFILFLRRDFKTLGRLFAVVIPLIAICWTALPNENKDFATGFDSHRENIRLRLAFIDIAIVKFKENPIFGAGVGLRKELDATNIVLMTMAETGIVGLLAFLGIHYVLLRMVWRAHLSLSRTSWSFSCLAIGGALVLVKLVHGCVDHYWSRGALTLAWAGAGIATRAFYVSQFVAPASTAIKGRMTNQPQFPPSRRPMAGLPPAI
ncbi:MAG TPA: O-antigen ligase family protein [Tepidisphaeraceae bacterium]|nr:O-antigen ligase family protein [Tepidisphaeraceae bacterium]